MTKKRAGFAGYVLCVDLTRGKIKQKPLDDDLAEKFIGGFGLYLKLAHDRIRPRTEALSSENPVILGAGPLVGTNLPSSSRVYAVTKLPTSGTIGWCGAGGVNFGYLLKNAGFDHVVIEGKSDHPVYLKIINDQVKICDADALWGKDVEKTYQILRESVQMPAGIISIGQAGENRIACVSCPIGCKEVVQIQDGKFKGFTAGSSSAMNLFTPMAYGFEDYREVVKCTAILDRYGLDMFEFFGIVNFAKTLCDNGIIPKNQIDTEIVIDSLASMETWAKKISFREGLGQILADGFHRILREFGEEAKAYAPSLVKGMHPYTGPGSALPWDLFGTMELGQLMEPGGPHIGSGGSPTYFARRPLDVFPRHLARLGVPEAAIKRILPDTDDPEQEGDLKIGSLLKYSHSWFTILGSLGICARGQINRFYSASLCAELYETVTGIKTSLEDLRRRVDRVWTLYKLANIREEVEHKGEVPPDQWIGESGFKNYVTQKPLTREEMALMMEDYYEEWGWDRKTGVPTPETLKKLGLMDT